MDFSFSSIEQLPNVKAAVAFIPDSGAVFREDTRLDTRVLNGGQRFVPWGMDNAMPYDIIFRPYSQQARQHPFDNPPL